MTATQLDLFGALDADTARMVDALTCLRDAVPEAMEAVIHLADWRVTEHRAFGYSGGWEYSIRRDGVHVGIEHVPSCGHDHHWGAQRTGWGELAGLLGADPRRPALIAWSESLTAIDAWRDRTRPHELWPDPWKWHPSYITSDHERPGWTDRIAAWRDLYALLDDAIARLDPMGVAA